MNDYLQKNIQNPVDLQVQGTVTDHEDRPAESSYSSSASVVVAEMNEYPVKKTSFGKIKYVQE